MPNPHELFDKLMKESKASEESETAGDDDIFSEQKQITPECHRYRHCLRKIIQVADTPFGDKDHAYNRFA